MSKQSAPAVHLCRFVGKADPDVKPKRGVRCELCLGEDPPKRKQATAYVVFRWGAAALCAAHTEEETAR